MSHPTLDVFFDTVQACQRTAALRSAIDLEIFTAIGEGAGTVAALAARCSASERGGARRTDLVRLPHDRRLAVEDRSRIPAHPEFGGIPRQNGSPAYLGGMVGGSRGGRLGGRARGAADPHRRQEVSTNRSGRATAAPALSVARLSSIGHRERRAKREAVHGEALVHATMTRSTIEFDVMPFLHRSPPASQVPWIGQPRRRAGRRQRIET